MRTRKHPPADRKKRPGRGIRCGAMQGSGLISLARLLLGRNEDATEPSSAVAYRRPKGQLTGLIVARRRCASLGGCSRWLPDSGLPRQSNSSARQKAAVGSFFTTALTAVQPRAMGNAVLIEPARVGPGERSTIVSLTTGTPGWSLWRE